MKKGIIVSFAVVIVLAVLTACDSPAVDGNGTSEFIAVPSVTLTGHTDFVLRSAGLSAARTPGWIRGVIEVEYTGSTALAFIRAENVVFRAADGRELFDDSSFFYNRSTLQVGDAYTNTYVTGADRRVRYYIIKNIGEIQVVLSDIATIEIGVSVSETAHPTAPEVLLEPSEDPYLETVNGATYVYQEFSNAGTAPALLLFSRVTYADADGRPVDWSFMSRVEHKVGDVWTVTEDPIGSGGSARLRDASPVPAPENTALAVGAVSLAWGKAD